MNPTNSISNQSHFHLSAVGGPDPWHLLLLMDRQFASEKSTYCIKDLWADTKKDPNMKSVQGWWPDSHLRCLLESGLWHVGRAILESSLMIKAPEHTFFEVQPSTQIERKKMENPKPHIPKPTHFSNMPHKIKWPVMKVF